MVVRSLYAGQPPSPPGRRHLYWRYTDLDVRRLRLPYGVGTSRTVSTEASVGQKIEEDHHRSHR